LINGPDGSKRIRPDIITMHWNRAVYREVGEIVSANTSLPPSGFFTFLADTYATTQSVAVRRQSEVDSRVVSVGTLLAEIADDPSRLTRERYLALHDADDAQFANQGFDHWAGPGGAHVRPDIVLDDLDRLKGEVEAVTRYVDRHLAHADQRPLPDLPTFEVLNAAIDFLGGLFNKYNRLIRASSWATLEPVAQYDWLGVFRVPWIPSDTWRGLPPMGPAPPRV
jgi:hypothetical protein